MTEKKQKCEGNCGVTVSASRYGGAIRIEKYCNVAGQCAAREVIKQGFLIDNISGTNNQKCNCGYVVQIERPNQNGQ